MLVLCDSCPRAMCAKHFPALAEAGEDSAKLDALLDGVTFQCPACWSTRQRKENKDQGNKPSESTYEPYIVSIVFYQRWRGRR